MQIAKCSTTKTIASFLNKTLRVRKIKDASANGLQVKSRKEGRISKVGFAVDGCISTFEKAKKQDVDLLVVHHGIKWRPEKDKGLTDARAAYLRKQNIALYAAHLPLDLHEEYGNNMQLARMLDLQDLQRFGKYHGIKIGYKGAFTKPMGLRAVASKLSKNLKSPCRVLQFGNARIKSIGIVSGGGGSILPDAVKEGVDCFLVGELDLALYNAAREHGMNLIIAGHYATETVGVKALMPLVAKTWNVKTVFIADPKDL